MVLASSDLPVIADARSRQVARFVLEENQVADLDVVNVAGGHATLAEKASRESSAGLPQSLPQGCYTKLKWYCHWVPPLH